MAEVVIPILCLIALSFLGWVFILKAEIQELKNQNRKLSARLDLGIRNVAKHAEVAKGGRSWGHKPAWMKDSKDK